MTDTTSILPSATPTDTVATATSEPPTPTETPISLYSVGIDVQWHDAAGNLLGGPPAGLPADYRVTAQSALGSATCAYSGGGLSCQYSNQSGGNSGLLFLILTRRRKR